MTDSETSSAIAVVGIVIADAVGGAAVGCGEAVAGGGVVVDAGGVRVASVEVVGDGSAVARRRTRPRAA